jgi:hypothetical protein
MPGLGGQMEFFTTVNNLLDTRPPLVPDLTLPGLTYPTIQSAYDVVQRQFTVGIRGKF